MPSGYLHQTCARRACALAAVTPVEAQVMTLGAQGPDILFPLGMFPLRPGSKPSPLGHALHQTRTGAFLLALCRRAKAGDAVDRAYALGFLTHYALDSTVHPYVYAQSYAPGGRYSSALHMRLEKNWDALYARSDGFKGTPVIMPGLRETEDHWPQLAALLQGAIGDVYPEQEATVEMMMEAFAASQRVNRLTHSPFGVKYGVAWLGERLIGKPGLATSQMTPRFPTRKEIMNESNQEWRNPAEPDVVRTESVHELFEAAVRRAASLLSAASKYFGGDIDEAALATLIGNVGYDTGMESKA